MSLISGDVMHHSFVTHNACNRKLNHGGGKSPYKRLLKNSACQEFVIILKTGRMQNAEAAQSFVHSSGSPCSQRRGTHRVHVEDEDDASWIVLLKSQLFAICVHCTGPLFRFQSALCKHADV